MGLGYPGSISVKLNNFVWVRPCVQVAERKCIFELCLNKRILVFSCNISRVNSIFTGVTVLYLLY